MQSAPSAALLSQLPVLATPTAIAGDDAAPLYTLLETDLRPVVVVGAASKRKSLSKTKHARAVANNSNNDDNDDKTVVDVAKAKIKAEIGVHAYINRLLKRLDPPRIVTDKLTSHSFRRGGAQHANGCNQLSVQRILGRGGWSETATNKGIAYIFNTPREDRKVARVLSDWGPDEAPVMADSAKLDSRAQEGLRRLRMRLFAECSGYDCRELDVDTAVLDVLTSTLVRHYPSAKSLLGDTPQLCRHVECVEEAGYDLTQLLSWSAALEQVFRDGNVAQKPSRGEKNDCGTSETCGMSCAGAHNAAVLGECLRVVEALLREIAPQLKHKNKHRKRSEPEAAVKPPAQKKRKNATAASLSAIWYEWYAHVPRLWESGHKSRRSDARLVAAYMRLLIVDGYALDEKSASYRDDVQRFGIAAKTALLAFLRERAIKASSYGTVLREMRKLHRSGALNDRIDAYRRLRTAALVVDPSPVTSLDVLAPQLQTFELQLQRKCA